MRPALQPLAKILFFGLAFLTLLICAPLPTRAEDAQSLLDKILKVCVKTDFSSERIMGSAGFLGIAKSDFKPIPLEVKPGGRKEKSFSARGTLTFIGFPFRAQGKVPVSITVTEKENAPGIAYACSMSFRDKTENGMQEVNDFARALVGVLQERYALTTHSTSTASGTYRYRGAFETEGEKVLVEAGTLNLGEDAAAFFMSFARE